MKSRKNNQRHKRWSNDSFPSAMQTVQNVKTGIEQLLQLDRNLFNGFSDHQEDNEDSGDNNSESHKARQDN